MYSIKQSKEGDLLLIIEPQSCDPDFPLFIYDGGDTALLFRDWGSTLRLGSLSEEARPALENAEEIYVVEMQGEDIYRDYFAPIRIVRDVNSLIEQ